MLHHLQTQAAHLCAYVHDGAVSGSFHVFLSHVWGTGQDQMRIVKQRLVEMLPDASVFLDVDDLKEAEAPSTWTSRVWC